MKCPHCGSELRLRLEAAVDGVFLSLGKDFAQEPVIALNGAPADFHAEMAKL